MKEVEVYKTGQRVFVAEKIIMRLLNYLIQQKHWFVYEYNEKYSRHEFIISMKIDLIKDIPAKLNNYITPAHDQTKSQKGE